MTMHFFDKSEKIVIVEPMVIGDDLPVTKYRAESDGRTFWAYNGMEVFYDDDRLYAALDEIAMLRNALEVIVGASQDQIVARIASDALRTDNNPEAS